jgi:hypothetical protein
MTGLRSTRQRTVETSPDLYDNHSDTRTSGRLSRRPSRRSQQNPGKPRSRIASPKVLDRTEALGHLFALRTEDEHVVIRRVVHVVAQDFVGQEPTVRGILRFVEPLDVDRCP